MQLLSQLNLYIRPEFLQLIMHKRFADYWLTTVCIRVVKTKQPLPLIYVHTLFIYIYLLQSNKNMGLLLHFQLYIELPLRVKLIGTINVLIFNHFALKYVNCNKNETYNKPTVCSVFRSLKSKEYVIIVYS